MQGFARLKTACEYADISMTTLKNWIRDGLRCTRIKGIVLIKYSDIDNYIDQFSKDLDIKASAIASEVMNDLQLA